MTDHYLIPDSARTIKILLLALMVIVVLVGAGVCLFIDSRPTTIHHTPTNMFIQTADIWVLKEGRWQLDTKREAVRMEDVL